MHQRLWLILPAAGFPLLIVLFVVLWQAVQRQNLVLQGLVERVEVLEGFDGKSKNQSTADRTAAGRPAITATATAGEDHGS